MPGGSNCSYADSWFTGEMWDRSDDDMKWSRSAWLQCQRAESWEEMPPVWKRIMRESWEELQEFLAMLLLPDGGETTAKFQAHAEAWQVGQRTSGDIRFCFAGCARVCVCVCVCMSARARVAPCEHACACARVRTRALVARLNTGV